LPYNEKLLTALGQQADECKVFALSIDENGDPDTYGKISLLSMEYLRGI